MVTPLQPLPAETYTQGAAVVTVDMKRYLPEAKTINYIPGITAQSQARRANPDAIEAVYCENGLITEGTRGNIFICQGGRWSAPRRWSPAGHHAPAPEGHQAAGRQVAAARHHAGRVPLRR